MNIEPNNCIYVRFGTPDRVYSIWKLTNNLVYEKCLWRYASFEYDDSDRGWQEIQWEQF